MSLRIVSWDCEVWGGVGGGGECGVDINLIKV